MGIPEKIKAIQDEMARTQINKATEHHLGLLRAKIAKLKREQEEGKSRKVQRLMVLMLEEVVMQLLYSLDRKSTRLNSSHMSESRMPSSA